MIESATAFNPNRPSEDTSFKLWQSSVRNAVMRRDPEGRTASPIPTFGGAMRQTGLAAQEYGQAFAPSTLTPETSTPANSKSTGDGYGFDDILDIFNPLQHLPVIGTLYRKFTGDTIKPASCILGGALFGGPIGAAASTINVIAKSSTGKDVAENVFSLAGIDMTPDQPKVPEIMYEGPVDLAGTTLAVANLSTAPYGTGHKNFAATAKVSGQTWNA